MNQDEDEGNNYENSDNPEDEQTSRTILPNKRKGEMFGVVEKLAGASRLSVMCEDGFTRTCRIPGKMKKRMWIREGDLVIVKPWPFQNEKADVVFRYTQTQANYLSRNNMLPEVINIFK
ncbi:translation initiation factor eIF-1A [Thermoplasmatales archaeon AK]|nr:translation initiation factor eIF-1A [Thermoplasmatales archaeon AK]